MLYKTICVVLILFYIKLRKKDQKYLFNLSGFLMIFKVKKIVFKTFLF